jgi:uncharacterized membrane protein YkgB
MSGIFNRIRVQIERRGIAILRLAVATVFIWFGVLKFFGSSDAESMALQTISALTAHSLSDDVALYGLAALECVIGLGMLAKKGPNLVLPLMYVQMLGTLLPLAIFPYETWQSFLVPTLEGQYIIKNAVLIAAGIVVGAAARGGKLISDPKVAKHARRKEKQKKEK